MRKLAKLIPLKFVHLVFILILGLGSFSALAQQEILLYASDFTQWGAMNGTNSGQGSYATGDGDGFYLFAKPQVKPTVSTPDGRVGIICSDNSTNYIDFRPFTFISGGAVEIEFYNYKNSKTFTLSGVAVTSSTINTQPAGPLPVSTISGAVFTSGKNFGPQKITYFFSDSGTKTIKLSTTVKCGEIEINSFKVYSGVGAVPYVAATNYPAAPAAGLSISAAVGGADVPGTVNVKAWNIGGDVTLSIVGTDAAKFSLPVSILTNAQALTGQNVTINFTPSVREGVSNAQLKVSSAGAPDYYVSLAGVTGGGTPKITTSPSVITIWTSLIAEKSTNVNIAGVSLTGPVSLSIQGAGASRFSLDATSVSLADASVGKDVKLTFVGDIKIGEHDAELVLTSPGANEVRIPLTGVTLQQKPVLYSLTFDVSPGGSAYVDTDIAGPYYLEGTTVTATITPETNKKVLYWSDAAGNNRVERSFTVGEFKNGVITIFMEDGIQTGGGGEEPAGELAGLIPTNVLETGFSITWTPVVDAVDYTVKVYDEFGSVLQTIPGLTGTSTDITGLLAGTLYKYSVETTVLTENHNTGELGPFRTAGTSASYNCGQ